MTLHRPLIDDNDFNWSIECLLGILGSNSCPQAMG